MNIATAINSITRAEWSQVECYNSTDSGRTLCRLRHFIHLTWLLKCCHKLRHGHAQKKPKKIWGWVLGKGEKWETMARKTVKSKQKMGRQNNIK